MEPVATEHSADACAVDFIRRFRNPIHYAINLEGVPAHQRDDVFQEMSERILKWHRDGRVLQEHAGLLSLVITTTRNICRNHYERDRRHRGHQDIAEHPVAGHEADALEQLHRLQAHERLHACVEMLPPMQRIVMRCVLKGWSNADIALEHNVHPNHVKVIAHRARIRLRQMLTNPKLN
jgi:RNA polymerase sigma factor (sigma-70 family)